MSVRSFALIGLLLAVAIFLTLQSEVLAMTSTNFIVNWDSLNSGGSDDSTSTNFSMRDTVGEQATGESTSANFAIRAGYRVGDQTISVLQFIVGTQENLTKIAHSLFSSSTKSVTVSSAVGLSVGDLIGIVENEGSAEIVASGRISSISGSIVTVDAWDGSPDLLSSSPSGGDDFVYRLNGSAADLGSLSNAQVNTALTGVRVLSDAQSGYTVYVNVDGNLRVSSSTFIANVADGSVTVGSEEYGAQIFGSAATGTGSDFAFSPSIRAIQSSTTTAAEGEGSALVYKVSISGATAAGSYAQQVYFLLTANY